MDNFISLPELLIKLIIEMAKNDVCRMSSSEVTRKLTDEFIEKFGYDGNNEKDRRKVGKILNSWVNIYMDIQEDLDDANDKMKETPTIERIRNFINANIDNKKGLTNGEEETYVLSHVDNRGKQDGVIVIKGRNGKAKFIRKTNADYDFYNTLKNVIVNKDNKDPYNKYQLVYYNGDAYAYKVTTNGNGITTYSYQNLNYEMKDDKGKFTPDDQMSFVEEKSDGGLYFYDFDMDGVEHGNDMFNNIDYYSKHPGLNKPQPKGKGDEKYSYLRFNKDITKRRDRVKTAEDALNGIADINIDGITPTTTGSNMEDASELIAYEFSRIINTKREEIRKKCNELLMKNDVDGKRRHELRKMISDSQEARYIIDQLGGSFAILDRIREALNEDLVFRFEDENGNIIRKKIEEIDLDDLEGLEIFENYSTIESGSPDFIAQMAICSRFYEIDEYNKKKYNGFGKFTSGFLSLFATRDENGNRIFDENDNFDIDYDALRTYLAEMQHYIKARKVLADKEVFAVAARYANDLMTELDGVSISFESTMEDDYNSRIEKDKAEDYEDDTTEKKEMGMAWEAEDYEKSNFSKVSEKVKRELCSLTNEDGNGRPLISVFGSHQHLKGKAVFKVIEQIACKAKDSADFLKIMKSLKDTASYGNIGRMVEKCDELIRSSDHYNDFMSFIPELYVVLRKDEMNFMEIYSSWQRGLSRAAKNNIANTIKNKFAQKKLDNLSDFYDKIKDIKDRKGKKKYEDCQDPDEYVKAIFKTKKGKDIPFDTPSIPLDVANNIAEILRAYGIEITPGDIQAGLNYPKEDYVEDFYDSLKNNNGDVNTEKLTPALRKRYDFFDGLFYNQKDDRFLEILGDMLSSSDESFKVVNNGKKRYNMKTNCELGRLMRLFGPDGNRHEGLKSLISEYMLIDAEKISLSEYDSLKDNEEELAKLESEGKIIIKVDGADVGDKYKDKRGRVRLEPIIYIGKLDTSIIRESVLDDSVIYTAKNRTLNIVPHNSARKDNPTEVIDKEKVRWTHSEGNSTENTDGLRTYTNARGYFYNRLIEEIFCHCCGYVTDSKYSVFETFDIRQFIGYDSQEYGEYGEGLAWKIISDLFSFTSDGQAVHNFDDVNNALGRNTARFQLPCMADAKACYFMSTEKYMENELTAYLMDMVDFEIRRIGIIKARKKAKANDTTIKDIGYLDKNGDKFCFFPRLNTMKLPISKGKAVTLLDIVNSKDPDSILNRLNKNDIFEKIGQNDKNVELDLSTVVRYCVLECRRLGAVDMIRALNNDGVFEANLSDSIKEGQHIESPFHTYTDKQLSWKKEVKERADQLKAIYDKNGDIFDVMEEIIRSAKYKSGQLEVDLTTALAAEHLGIDAYVVMNMYNKYSAYALFYANFLNFAIGDIAIFKDYGDATKRLKALHAPSSKMYTKSYYGRDVQRTVIMRDEIIVSRAKNEIIAFLKNCDNLTEKQKELIIKELERVNAVDGMSYCSFSSMRSQLDMSAKWNEEMEESFNRLKNGTWDFQDLTKVTMPSQKPMFTGPFRQNDKLHNSFRMFHQTKDSRGTNLAGFALIPNILNASPTLAAMDRFMEDNIIDVMSFKSTIKIGLTDHQVDFSEGTLMADGKVSEDMTFDEKVDAIYESISNQVFGEVRHKGEGENYTAQDYREKVKQDDYKSEMIRELPTEYLGWQQENPNHLINHFQLIGTQIRKLIRSDMRDSDIIYMPDTNEPITKGEFMTRFAYLNSANIMENLIDFNESIKDIHGMSRFLKNIMRNSDKFSKDMERAFDVITDENGTERFNLEIMEPSTWQNLESMINSAINKKVVRQKIRGGSATQVACFGAEELTYVFEYITPDGRIIEVSAKELAEKFRNDIEAMDADEKNKFIQDALTKAVNTESGGKLRLKCMECYLPVYDDKMLRYLYETQGPRDVFDASLVPDEMLRAVGYRIPTEDKYSMAPLKIKGFLAPSYGSTIVVPAEITLFAGSDFDIDHMYLMLSEIVTKARDEVNYKLYTQQIYQRYIDRDRDEKAIPRGFDKQLFEKAIEIIWNKYGTNFNKVEEIFKDIFNFSPKNALNALKKEGIKGFTVDMVNMFKEHLDENRWGYTHDLVRKKVDFSKNKPCMDRSARNNSMIDLYYGVLSSPAALNQFLNPGNFDDFKCEKFKTLALRRGKDIIISNELLLFVKEGEAWIEFMKGGEDYGVKCYKKDGKYIIPAKFLSQVIPYLNYGQMSEINKANGLSEGMDPLSPASTVYYYYQNMKGKSMTAIYASSSAGHAVLQAYRPKAQKIKMLGMEGGLVYDDIFTNADPDTGVIMYISKLQGMPIGASTDTAKEPTLTTLNLNDFGSGVYALLTSSKFPLRYATAITTQPIIQIAASSYNNTKISNPMIGIEKFISRFNKEIGKIISESTNSNFSAKFKEIIENSSTFSLNGYDDIEQLSNDLVIGRRFNSLRDIKRLLESGNEEDIAFLTRQIQVLRFFMDINSEATRRGKCIAGLKTDAGVNHLVSTNVDKLTRASSISLVSVDDNEAISPAKILSLSGIESERAFNEIINDNENLVLVNTRPDILKTAKDRHTIFQIVDNIAEDVDYEDLENDSDLSGRFKTYDGTDKDNNNVTYRVYDLSDKRSKHDLLTWMMMQTKDSVVTSLYYAGLFNARNVFNRLCPFMSSNMMTLMNNMENWMGLYLNFEDDIQNFYRETINFASSNVEVMGEFPPEFALGLTNVYKIIHDRYEREGMQLSDKQYRKEFISMMNLSKDDVIYWEQLNGKDSITSYSLSELYNLCKNQEFWNDMGFNDSILFSGLELMNPKEVINGDTPAARIYRKIQMKIPSNAYYMTYINSQILLTDTQKERGRNDWAKLYKLSLEREKTEELFDTKTTKDDERIASDERFADVLNNKNKLKARIKEINKEIEDNNRKIKDRNKEKDAIEHFAHKLALAMYAHLVIRNGASYQDYSYSEFVPMEVVAGLKGYSKGLNKFIKGIPQENNQDIVYAIQYARNMLSRSYYDRGYKSIGFNINPNDIDIEADYKSKSEIDNYDSYNIYYRDKEEEGKENPLVRVPKKNDENGDIKKKIISWKYTLEAIGEYIENTGKDETEITVDDIKKAIKEHNKESKNKIHTSDSPNSVDAITRKDMELIAKRFKEQNELKNDIELGDEKHEGRLYFVKGIFSKNFSGFGGFYAKATESTGVEEETTEEVDAATKAAEEIVERKTEAKEEKEKSKNNRKLIWKFVKKDKQGNKETFVKFRPFVRLAFKSYDRNMKERTTYKYYVIDPSILAKYRSTVMPATDYNDTEGIPYIELTPLGRSTLFREYKSGDNSGSLDDALMSSNLYERGYDRPLLRQGDVDYIYTGDAQDDTTFREEGKRIMPSRRSYNITIENTEDSMTEEDQEGSIMDDDDVDDGGCTI